MEFKTYVGHVTTLNFVGNRYAVFSVHVMPHFHYKAGQHLAIQFSDEAGKFFRFYSIASAPHAQDTLEFCVLLPSDSRVSNVFRSLQPGDTIALSEPMGQFYLHEPERPLVFVAGGSGIAPIRSLLHATTQQLTRAPKHSLSLLYGCDDATTIPFYEELANFAQRFPQHVRLVTTARQGSRPGVISGLVTAKLASAVAPSAHYYLCGPEAMLNACIQVLASQGVTPDVMFMERY